MLARIAVESFMGLEGGAEGEDGSGSSNSFFFSDMTMSGPFSASTSRFDVVLLLVPSPSWQFDVIIVSLGEGDGTCNILFRTVLVRSFCCILSFL